MANYTVVVVVDLLVGACMSETVQKLKSVERYEVKRGAARHYCHTNTLPVERGVGIFMQHFDISSARERS